MRAVLGAGRRRLISQLLNEALVLSLAGAIGGLLLSGEDPIGPMTSEKARPACIYLQTRSLILWSYSRLVLTESCERKRIQAFCGGEFHAQ